jgi:hypothetical protein
VVGPVWVTLNCAEAFARAGVHDRARACLRRGAARAREIAALLPDEYRASYVQRNPVVRAVLEAERHCSAQGAGADWTRVAGIVAGASTAQAWLGGPTQ